MRSLAARFGLALFVLHSLAGCSSEETEHEERPNILVIFVDELRGDTLGATGHPTFQSPCIDSLADEGVLFEQSFVVTSLCSPSRATFLTGLDTPEHGVLDIWTEFDPAFDTIGTALDAEGYETAWIGKSHLNPEGTPLPGFDRWLSFPGQGEYFNPTVNVNGEIEQRVGHMTDVLTEEALSFLDEHQRDRPFLLVLSHLAAHQPWTPQARFLGTYANTPVEQPPSWFDDLSDQPAFLECRQMENWSPAAVRRYLEILAGVEESTCRLLARLEKQGVLDDTVVIFTSDNGYLLGEHRLGDKRAAYEESIRVPLLIRYPTWFPAGTTVADELALNLDLAPTILWAAGLDARGSLDGIPLHHLASGRSHRDRFVYRYFQDLCSNGEVASCTPTMRALRTRRHMYVDYQPTRIVDELYDLQEDPFQMTNRIDDPTYAALADSLLDDLVARAGEWPPRRAATSTAY